MKRISLSFMAVLFTSAMMAPAALAAYPGYGKRIDPSLSNSCRTCHVVYPKLRLYGKTVREIGYSVPLGEFDDPVLMKIYRNLPVAIRGKIDILDPDQGSPVSVNELQILSGGNAFNDRFSWWFHKHIMEGNEFVKLSSGTPHEAWMQFNGSKALHIRAGMFELPMWFSWSKTKVSELGYLYYTSTTNADNFGLIAAPQFGIQINGAFSLGSGDEDDWGEPDDANMEGYNYALSITNGETSFAGKVNTFFGRITRKRPESAIGLFALAAVQDIAMEADHMHSAEPMADPTSEIIYKLGLDGELYLRGDDATLYGSAAFGSDVERSFVGGFIGYDRLILPNLFLFARLDGVFFTPEEHVDDMDGMDHGADAAHVHGTVISDDASAVYLGAAYMVLGNIRLSAEYRYGIDGIDNRGLMQLQFAF